MSRKIQEVIAVLWAVTMIGADSGGGCNPWAGSGSPSAAMQPRPPPRGPEGPLPYCYEDPPYGCSAYCSGTDLIQFNEFCKGVDASTREEDFELAVAAKHDEALMQGIHVCDGTNTSPDGVTGPHLTPCAFGIEPVEFPGQDHTACMSAPPGCPW